MRQPSATDGDVKLRASRAEPADRRCLFIGRYRVICGQHMLHASSSHFDPTPDMDATVRTQSLLLFENRPIHLTGITVHLTFELDRNP